MREPLYIIQHAFSEPNSEGTPNVQEQLHELARPLWQAWAERHGGQYLCSNYRVKPERSVYWEKIWYLMLVLNEAEDGTVVVMPDGGDTLPRQPWIDPRWAIPHGCDVGMVWSEVARCFNAGAWWLVNSPLVRDWLAYIWNGGDTENPHVYGWEQARTNTALGYPRGHTREFPKVGEILRCTDGKAPAVNCIRLDAKWNAYRWVHNTVWPPIIEAWHGDDKATLLPIFTAARKEFDEGGGIWQP